MEVLVSATLLIMLASLVTAFLVPCMKAQVRGSAQSDEQRQAATSLEAMARDLRGTTYGGVSLLNRQPPDDEQFPVVMGIVRASDVNGIGRLVWEEKVVCYVWDRPGQRLFYREWPPGPGLTVELSTSAPRRLLETDLLIIAGLPPAKVLAYGVTAMDVQHPAGRGPDVNGPLTISLELHRDVAHQKGPEIVQMTQTIACRN